MKADSLKNSKDEQQLSELMRCAQKGDAEAYRNLLLRLKAMVESFVKNSLFRGGQFSPANVEDISQEVLLAIHSKRHTYDPAQFFLPWFYAIARYKLIDYLRANKKRSQEISLEDEDIPNFTEENESASVDAQALVGSLPLKQKTVVDLVKMQGLSIAEASQRTGYSESDIKVTIHRAIKALRVKLGGKDGKAD